MIKAQEWLDKNYPKERRKEITQLDIREKNLEGILDLSDFVDLKWLNCKDNKLISLNLTNCLQLETVYCSDNQLAEYWQDIDPRFDYSDRAGWKKAGFNKEQTKKWIKAGLHPRNYKFIDWLKDNKKLGLEWAINNKEEFADLQERYLWYRLCEQCHQPNTGTGFANNYWCQPCNAKHFQDEFKNWTSGNSKIDKFIQNYQLKATSRQKILEWIPYDRFTNIEYLAEGGFSQVYKAEWTNGFIMEWSFQDNKWKRMPFDNGIRMRVALKFLNNSQNITLNFLTEIASTKLVESDHGNVTPCYGISQDPKTKNYLIVMKYQPGGNLRQHLQGNYDELGFENKLQKLSSIVNGLKVIHKQGLVHRDFHSGNILNGHTINNIRNCHITDLGLCRPANETNESNVYGVIPYVAPEVLRGQPYTQASDIYSFGIIAYEILTSLPPYTFYDEDLRSYKEVDHDTDLTLAICFGLRPKFYIKIPQPLEDLIIKCWDTDPLKRPNVNKLEEELTSWVDTWGDIIEGTDFAHQIREAEEDNQVLPDHIRFPNYQKHIGAVYTSRMINTKQITELLNDLNLSEKVNIQKSQEVFLKDSEDFEDLRIKSSGLTKEVEKITLGTKRKNSLSAETKGEKKSVRLEESAEKPMDVDYSLNWTNIHLSFTDELVKKWQDLGFTSNQVREWINIGLQTTDYNFCAWLRDATHLTPEQVLNKGNLEQLNQNFFTHWQEQQQSNIEILPKK